MDRSAALLEQNRLLGDLLLTADPAVPVPSCPGWTLRQLLTHVGRGDRWAAAVVRGGGPVEMRAVPEGRPPEDVAAAVGWLAGSARLLLDAVAAAGPDAPVWTFLGPRPSSWWVRRRLHESLVHRADAALSVGAPFAADPAVAADGVSEWLDLVAARPGDPPLPEGVVLHLHATDEGLGEAGEWIVRADGWEHGHGKGAAAVRGRSADLLLALLRRVPADDPRLQVLGDPGVLAGWLARTPF